MPHTTTPYVGGNYASVINMLANSINGHIRMACIGDSREDFQSSHGGKHSQYQINKFLRKKYGRSSELPYAHMAFPIGSSTSVQAYCLNTGHPYQGSAGPTISSLLPPRYPYFSTNSGQHSPLCQLLPWGISRSGVPAHIDESGALEFDPTRSDVVCDVLCKKNSSGPNELRWIYNPTSNTTQNTFATTVTSGVSTGLELDADSTSIVKFTTPALAHQPANQYAQVKVVGANAANDALVANGHIWGMRYRHNGLSKGVSYTSMAIAGSLWDYWNAAIVLTSGSNGTVPAFGDSGPALAAMGPFDITRFAGGVNDYSGNTIEGIEADTRAFITAWRTLLDDPTHQILLESPHMRGAWPGVNYDAVISEIADVYYRISNDTENVAFYNVSRALEDLGYDPADTDWTPDTIHLHQYGDYVKARLVVDMWAGLYSPSVATNILATRTGVLMYPNEAAALLAANPPGSESTVVTDAVLATRSGCLRFPDKAAEYIAYIAEASSSSS